MHLKKNRGRCPHVQKVHSRVLFYYSYSRVTGQHEYTGVKNTYVICNYVFSVSSMDGRGLMEQDLSKLDVRKLHSLSPEVILGSTWVTTNGNYRYVFCSVIVSMENV